MRNHDLVAEDCTYYSGVSEEQYDPVVLDSVNFDDGDIEDLHLVKEFEILYLNLPV